MPEASIAIADPSLHAKTQDYKRLLSGKMRAVSAQDVAKIQASRGYTATRKYDGEFSLVFFDGKRLLYIAAFNHLTPFPGTPLYERLVEEKRLLYDSWWLDDRYSYNHIPFQPRGMEPETLRRHCIAARREFYSWRSIARRGFFD